MESDNTAAAAAAAARQVSEINEVENKSVRADVDYDELVTAAGELGLYQILLFISTFPFYWFGAFTYFGQIFITEVAPNHWCWIPELGNLTDIERRTLAIPLDEDARFGYSQCQAYLANWSYVLATGHRPDSTWRIEPCQNGWEFNKTEIPYPTISSEMGWVCERDSYQATAQSIFFVGSIVGGFLIGWLADRFGRIPAAVFSNMIGCVAGVASIFARNFVQFAVCRFFVGMSFDNCLMMIYILILEYVAPKYRTIIANMPFAIFFSSAVVALPWISLACGHWKIISVALSIPMALSLLTPFVIPESPRWLLSKGRIDDTVSKVLRMARLNKKEVPTELIEQFKQSASRKIDDNHGGILEILKRPLLRNMFICMSLLYMCNEIVMFALVRSLGQLQYNFFISFTVVSLTELPSLLIISFIMEWTGRKWLSIVTLSITSVFSFLTALIGSGLPSVLCAAVARFTNNMSANVALQWAAEVLPTPVRGSGVSVIHICSYVATISSPFIVYLETYAYWVPLVVIGGVAALGAVASAALPETADKQMPQTFEDAEEMIRSQKFLEFPCKRKVSDQHTRRVNVSLEMK